MRWPRPRLSLKTLMILVAVAALILTDFIVQRRRIERLSRDAFWTQAEAKFDMAYDFIQSEARTAYAKGDRNSWGDAGLGALRDHATRMRRKWALAASRPWTSTVEPDELPPIGRSQVRLFYPPDLPPPPESKRP
jgi:hypothetical protein